MKIYTYDPKKRKTVLCGSLDGTVFTRDVTSAHYMKVMQGYGIQEDAFQEILEKGCDKIVIKTKTDEYVASMLTWVDKGKIADYSAGKQRFVSLKFMKIRKFRYDPTDKPNTVVKVEYLEDVEGGEDNAK